MAPAINTYRRVLAFKKPVSGGAAPGVGIDPITLASNTLTLEADEQYLSVRTAAQFTSANSEYLSTETDDFVFENQSWSMGCWVYVDDVGASNKAIFSQWEVGAPFTQTWVVYLQSDDVKFAVKDSVNQKNHIIASALTTSTWHYVVASYDQANNRIRISVDGGTYVDLATVGAINFDYDNITYIGSFDTGLSFMNGRMDSMAVYGKSLSQSEVTALYNSGNGQNYTDTDKVSLISFYAFNETSDTRYDLHGGNHLADNNTVTYEDGKVLDRGEEEYGIGKAAEFSASSDILNSSSASFDMGDEDFSYGCWFKATDTGLFGSVMAKYGTSGNRAYSMYIFTDKIVFIVSNDGTATTSITSTGGLTDNTWHFAMVYHDSVNNLIGVSVDGETIKTSAWSSGIHDTSDDFKIGDGIIGIVDGAFFYNKVLTQTEVNTLYAGGVGVNYEAMDKVSLLAHWSLNEASGTRADSHTNALDLTDINTVTQATGIVADELQTLYDISYWNDRSGNGNHFEQIIPASRPQYNSTTGKITMVSASNEYIGCINGSTPFDSDTQGEIIAVYKRLNGSSKTAIPFSVGNSAVANHNHTLIHWRGDFSSRPDKIELDSDAGNRIGYVATDTDSQILITSMSSNSSRYRNSINDVELPITVDLGSDNGEWMSSLPTPNSCWIGRQVRTTAAYSDKELYAIYYFDTELTTLEREGVMAYINNKYNAYTPIVDPVAHFGTDLKLYLNMADATSILDNQRLGVIAQGLVDLSKERALDAGYVADWSVGVDSWSTGGTTLIGGLTSFGRNDCIEMTQVSGSIIRGGGPAQVIIGNVEEFTFEYYLPSGQSCDGFSLESNTGISYYDGRSTQATPAVFDTWTTVTVQAVPNNAIPRFRIWDGNGGTPVAGDKLYLRAYRSSNVQGNHFTQTTNSAMPAIAVGQVNYDGVAESMEDSLGELFTEISGDTQGEWIALFDDDEGTGVNVLAMGIVGPTVSNHMGFGLKTNDILTIFSSDSGVGNDIQFGSAQARNVETELSVSSGGSSYKMFSKFEEQAYVSGVNDGDWIGDNGVFVNITIGRLLSFYYALGLKRLIYINRQQGMDERRQFRKFRLSE